MTERDWGYAENVWLVCPDCGFEVAIETDTREFAGGRCIQCDEMMDIEYR